MTPFDDQVDIPHMGGAVEKNCLHRDNSRQNLEDDEILRLTVTNLVDIVGEDQAGQRTDTERAPGRALVGGGAHGDRLTHHYFDV